MPTTDLKLHLKPGADALHRVLCVCRRRGLEVLALTYADHELTLTVAGPPARRDRLALWIGALLDVSVRERPKAFSVGSR